MANIEIKNLQLAGSELFQDSETFLNEMSDSEVWSVQGGISIGTVSDPLASASSATLGDITSGTAGGLFGGLFGGFTAGLFSAV